MRIILSDEKLIDILGEIGKGVLAHENKIRAKLGLSEAEYNGILCIEHEEKITCQEFSKRMDLSVSRGSRVVDRLCAKKFIERVDCDSDRRCKNIWLTSDGSAIRQKIGEEIRNFEEVLIAGYPDAKLTLLKSDFRRLCGKL